MPFSLFYGAGDIFRATNLNALLKTTRRMPVRADQILKKLTRHWDHGCNFPRGFMAAISQSPWFFETRRLFERESSTAAETYAP
jgi:hypothetical protein